MFSDPLPGVFLGYTTVTWIYSVTSKLVTQLLFTVLCCDWWQWWKWYYRNAAQTKQSDTHIELWIIFSDSHKRWTSFYYVRILRLTNPILGRILMRGESPHSSGDSPKQTPQSSPPPAAVSTGIHQVRSNATVMETSNSHKRNFRKMSEEPPISTPPVIRPAKQTARQAMAPRTV